MGWTAERKLSLTGEHLLGIFLTGFLYSSTEQGTGEITTPAHQAFIIQRRRKSVQQHRQHMPRRATPGGPLGTLTELGKSTTAYLVLEKQSSNPQDNTYFYM